MVPKLPKLPVFNTIGHAEKVNVLRSLRYPLSGYLGGEGASKGYFVTKLEREWAETFGVKHAIACNSATSGLFAAAIAAGVNNRSIVLTTPFTMSATAAVAYRLGAQVWFIDIEDTRYSLDPEQLPSGHPRVNAMIVANIFGHPAYLSRLRAWADKNNVVLIEDNAQSPFAMENGKYAGTVGHMGVFSLNVHKHIQAGEGGIVTTNDDALAAMLRDVVNHGELSGGMVGLNLRMTEPVAAIACAQLRKAPAIIHGRRELAHNLGEIFSLLPWIKPSREDEGCTHVYYLWSARVPPDKAAPLLQRLAFHNVPVRYGYSTLLNDLFDPVQRCPVAEQVNKSIITFEVCAHDPRTEHLTRLRRVIEYVRDAIELEELQKRVA